MGGKSVVLLILYRGEPQHDGAELEGKGFHGLPVREAGLRLREIPAPPVPTPGPHLSQHTTKKMVDGRLGKGKVLLV